MNHSFSIAHACAYGIKESILIQNLYFWISHNYANGTHRHDEKTWTYNSVRAFERLFPYLTYKQIRNALDGLVTQGVIVRGNYNKNPADRISWFAFTDEFLQSYPLPESGAPKTQKTPAKPATTPFAPPGTPFAPQGTPFAPQGTPFAPQGTSLIETDVRADVIEKEEGSTPTSPPPIFSEQPAADSQQPAASSQQPTAQQPNSSLTKKDQGQQPTADSQQPTALQARIEAVDVQRVTNGKKPLNKLDIKKIHQEAAAAGIDTISALDWVLESPTRNFFKSDYYTPTQAPTTSPAAFAAPATPPPEPLTAEEQATRKAAREAAAAAAAEEASIQEGIWDYQRVLTGPKWAIDLVNDYLSGKPDIDNSSIKRFDACKALGIKEKALLTAHNDACAALAVMENA